MSNIDSNDNRVYSLIDPRTSEPFYIGVTYDPERRYRDHLNPKEKGGRKLKNKIMSLLKQNVIPEMIFLFQNLTLKEAFDLETKLIKIARDYYGKDKISNIANGGNAPPPMTPNQLIEHRKRMSSTFKGRPVPLETRIKISNSLKGRKPSPEAIAKSAKTRTGMKFTESRMTNLKKAARKRSKPINQYDLNHNLIKEWESLSLASDFGFSRGCLSTCVTGKTKTHKGFIWKYKQI